jgi:hypothetical protein
MSKINEKLLSEFEEAVIKLQNDMMYESADPNRESSYYSRQKVDKLREKILKKMNKEE